MYKITILNSLLILENTVLIRNILFLSTCSWLTALTLKWLFCMCNACVCGHEYYTSAHGCTGPFMHAEARVLHEMSFSITLYFVFCPRSLTELRADWLVQLVWLLSKLQGPVCLHSPCTLQSPQCWGYRCLPPSSALYSGAGDRNSGPHASEASNLPTKPSS